MSELVVISICTLTGLTRMEWAICLREQHFVMRQYLLSVIQGTKPVSAARNLALHEAREKGARYCVFYDDDIVPRRPDAISHLISALDQVPEATLIGSVCPIRGPYPEPIVIKELGTGPWWGWKDGQLHQVYHSGTGFLAIRMADIETIDVPTETVEGVEVKRYFQEYQKPGDHLGTDDYWLAAVMKDNGKRWLVHGDVICDQIDRQGKWYKIEDAMVSA